MFYDSLYKIKAQSKEGQILKETKVFIWNNNLPFQGKIMVLGKDFRQLLPIKIYGTRDEAVNLFIKNSKVVE